MSTGTDHVDIIGVITPPPKKLNAASQFRKKRVLNALLSPNDVTDESFVRTPHDPTPTRTLYHAPLPENNRSQLSDALEMAARPLHVGSATTGDFAMAVEQPSASSISIEEMAALVEASHNDKRITAMKEMAARRNDSINHQRNDSIGSLSSARKLSTSIMGLFALSIILSFLMCESLLGVLVFSQQDVRSKFQQYVHDVAVARMVWVKSERNTIDANIITDNNNEVHSNVLIIDTKREIALVNVDSDAGINDYNMTYDDDSDELEVEPPSHRDIDPIGELARLESVLELGNTKLTYSGRVSSDYALERKSVDSLCGEVWSATNAIMRSSKYQRNTSIEPREIVQRIRSSGTRSCDELTAQSELQVLKSLAFEAQSCLGGAGLSFLSVDDLDYERLRMSTKIFTELSRIETSNADVRAGLGTSLLIQGIYYEEIISHEGGEKDDNVKTSLLSLAAHYLTLALSISDATVSESTSHAAILHNLALAYTAQGDYGSAVPILLLRATSCGREHFATTKPYWNVPGDLLQKMEKKALVIGAAVPKKSHNKKSKKKRIPFLSFHEDKK